MKPRFEQASKAQAWFGVSEKQGHTDFATNDAVQYSTRAWVYAQIFDDSGSARRCFYGPGWTLKEAAGWKEALKNNAAP